MPESHIQPTQTLAEVECAHIRKVYAEADGNISKTARLLGIDRNTLYRKLQRHGLVTGPRSTRRELEAELAELRGQLERRSA